MYRPEAQLFAFTLRRRGSSDSLEGISRRYSAIVLIGLADEPDESAAYILQGDTRQALCDRLVAAIRRSSNLGDVALTLWAARVLNHRGAAEVLRQIAALDPHSGRHSTVEIAWTLAALAVQSPSETDSELARSAATRLLESFRPESDVFSHQPNGDRSRSFRSHVACFADLVYPVHALSHYGVSFGNGEALRVARRCADRICESQGPDGQWWWHFDVRSNRIIERYPVYAVHQDAMAPMALFAAQAACGTDYGPSIRRGLAWLNRSPEIGGSLIDDESGLIWRKVSRREPGKLSRGVQAAASRLHPRLRAPGIDRVFPACRVDFESRPYHMGWVLYAWSGGRPFDWARGISGERHEQGSSRLADPPSV